MPREKTEKDAEKEKERDERKGEPLDISGIPVGEEIPDVEALDSPSVAGTDLDTSNASPSRSKSTPQADSGREDPAVPSIAQTRTYPVSPPADGAGGVPGMSHEEFSAALASVLDNTIPGTKQAYDDALTESEQYAEQQRIAEHNRQQEATVSGVVQTEIEQRRQSRR